MPYDSVTATASGSPSPPWNVVSSPRSRPNVQLLMSRYPTTFGGTTADSLNGSRRDTAVMAFANHCPRASVDMAPLCRALSPPGDDPLPTPAAGGRSPFCPLPTETSKPLDGVSPRHPAVPMPDDPRDGSASLGE